MDIKRIPIEELLVIMGDTTLSEMGAFLTKYVNYYAECCKDATPSEIWKLLVTYVNISLQKKFMDDTIDALF